MTRTKIRKAMATAMSDFDMVRPGDKVMVCVSGGKDSSVMLALLEEIRQKAPFAFEIQAVILDQKQPGFRVDAYRDWVSSLGLTLEVIEENTYDIVKEKTAPGKSFCGLCSRLRRGILYNYAHERGYNRLALGHHRGDANETLLLNLFFSGAVASMPPKLRSKDARNVVIRPMIRVSEVDLAEVANDLEVPVIPCNLCGNQEGLQRAQMKKLMADLGARYPRMDSNIGAAIENIKPKQMADRAWQDFAGW